MVSFLELDQGEPGGLDCKELAWGFGLDPPVDPLVDSPVFDFGPGSSGGSSGWGGFLGP